MRWNIFQWIAGWKRQEWPVSQCPLQLQHPEWDGDTQYCEQECVTEKPLWPQYNQCLTMAPHSLCVDTGKATFTAVQLCHLCVTLKCIRFSNSWFSAEDVTDVLFLAQTCWPVVNPEGSEVPQLGQSLSPQQDPGHSSPPCRGPVLQTHTGSAASMALQCWLIKSLWAAKEGRLMCYHRDHRRVEVGRGLWRPADPTPCSSMAPQSSLPRTRSRQLLSISSCKHQARQTTCGLDSFPESCVCAWEQKFLTCNCNGHGVSGPSTSRDTTAVHPSISYASMWGATNSSSNTTRQLLCTAEVWHPWGWSSFGNIWRQSSSWIWRWYFGRGSGQFACF